MKFNFVVDLCVVPPVFNSVLFRRITAILFSNFYLRKQLLTVLLDEVQHRYRAAWNADAVLR